MARHQPLGRGGIAKSSILVHLFLFMIQFTGDI
jgi:hypothetical protein